MPNIFTGITPHPHGFLISTKIKLNLQHSIDPLSTNLRACEDSGTASENVARASFQEFHCACHHSSDATFLHLFMVLESDPGAWYDRYDR